MPVVGGCGSPPEPALEGFRGQFGCRDRAPVGGTTEGGGPRHAFKFNIADAGCVALPAPLSVLSRLRNDAGRSRATRSESGPMTSDPAAAGPGRAGPILSSLRPRERRPESHA